MNFEKMSLDELKNIAKEKGIVVGNIGKDKLISKLKSAEATTNVLAEDDDLVADVEVKTNEPVKVKSQDTLSSIIDAIDEETDEGTYERTAEELPSDTVIRVRSITYGTLIYNSSINNASFIWNEIGAVNDMTIGEITAMNNSHPDFLHKPYVILLDERAIRQFRLSSVYENVAKISNLKTLFNSDIYTIEKTIDEALMVNMRDMLISKITTMYKNGSLKDINIIRLLEQKLQYDILTIDKN